MFHENRDGVGVGAGAYVGAGDGTPSGSNPREPLFLINYINLFNSRGQFPSYLIFAYCFLVCKSLNYLPGWVYISSK